MNERKPSTFKTVLVKGAFDLLHVGHIELFEFAASLGDNLVVGLKTDRAIRKQKGENRPINCFEHRSRLISSLKMVDSVLPIDSHDLATILSTTRPDAFIASHFLDSNGLDVRPDFPMVQFILAPKNKTTSTTIIIGKIRAQK